MAKTLIQADEFCLWQKSSAFFERGLKVRKYIYIGIGGFCGAILRYLFKSIRFEHYTGSFPVQTLLINLAGCFLLTALFALAAGSPKIKPDLKLGIATGFIGSFTTFSTMCKEIASMMAQGFYITAFAYAAVSLILGLAACYLGQRSVLLVRAYNQARKAEIQPDLTGEGGEES